MPFKKGEGGRPKGARNLSGREVRDIFLQLGGPNGELYAQQLHDIATKPHRDLHARLKALQTIAPYVWKKLAERHEVTSPDGSLLPRPVILELHTGA